MRSRVSVLVHPWFTGAVLLLAVNDQLLKERWPGLVTGKLSDVAGVVVIGVLASVALGRRLGLAATAAAFCVLKVLPGVAEALTPVLGGLTRRDPSDIIALVALVPTSRWLRTALPSGGDDLARGGIVGSTLVAVAASTSIMATTATSCTGPASIESVAVADGALVAAGDGTTWRSSDGGDTWTRSQSNAPRSKREACDGDECYRVVPGESLVRCAGEECTTAYAFSGEQRRRMAATAECGVDVDRDFLSVATGDRPDGEPIVLAAMGNQGVLVGTSGGELERLAVGDAAPLSIGGPPSWTTRLLLAPLVLFVAGPVVLLLTAQRRRGRVTGPVAVAMGGAVVLAVGVAWNGLVDGDPRRAGLIVAVCSALVFGASLWWATRPVAPASGVPGRMIPPPEWAPPRRPPPPPPRVSDRGGG